MSFLDLVVPDCRALLRRHYLTWRTRLALKLTCRVLACEELRGLTSLGWRDAILLDELEKRDAVAARSFIDLGLLPLGLYEKMARYDDWPLGFEIDEPWRYIVFVYTGNGRWSLMKQEFLPPCFHEWHEVTRFS
jgi:hypothetical protein